MTSSINASTDASPHDNGYQLALLKIPVGELRRAADFYCDALGFEEQFVVEEYGWAQLSAGGLPVGLYVPGQGGGNGTVGGSLDFHLVLPAERFNQLAQDLHAHGALVEDRIQRSDDGTTFIDVCDPDGNVLKILCADGEAEDEVVAD